MARQFTITDRVKFLIKYIIGQGLAQNQEDLGRQIGISNKSYLSQLVNNRIPNDSFIDGLLNFAPNFNKEWLYNETIESPFLKDITENLETSLLLGKAIGDEALQKKIEELTTQIELLQKDVHYYADMAGSRLQTINLQSLAIEKLSKLVDLLEKQLTPAK